MRPAAVALTRVCFAAVSLEAFVQQLACRYLLDGYRFFTTGWIPDDKDPREIDRKLVTRYDADRSKWKRARAKQAGVANVRYLRHERFFVLLATAGRHPIFEREVLKDLRKSPIRYAGYSVSVRGGHAHVRVELEQYKDLKAYLVSHATRASADALARAFASLPFEPYAPVRRQLVTLLRHVNRARAAAQLGPVPFDCLRLARRQVKVFEAHEKTLR